MLTKSNQPQQLPGAVDSNGYRELNVRLMCKDCRNPVPNIIEEFSQGDLVCGDCGLVLGDRIIDTRSEWRTFANDEGDDPSRVGAAADPLLEGSQLDTTISTAGMTGSLGKALSRTLNRSNPASKAERNRMQAYKDIAAYCEAAEFPKSVTELAKSIYKRVDETKSMANKRAEYIIAGSIYLACRQEGVARTFKEISAITGLPSSDIGKSFKMISNLFEKNMKTRTTSTSDLMGRYCNVLNLSMEIQLAATDLAKSATRLVDELAGRSPVSVAAASIYFTSHLFGCPVTAQNISSATGVSPSTIKSAYKHLLKEKSRLVDISSYSSNVSFNSLPEY